MNRTMRLGLAALVLGLGLGSTGAARADILTDPEPTVSGPGGAGVALVGDPQDPFLLGVLKEYTNVDFLDVTFTVDSSQVYILSEFIFNGTGETWTGFRYALIAAPAGSSFLVAADFSNHFTDQIANNPGTSFSFTMGSVTNGDGFSPTVGITVADAGEVIVRQTPLVPAAAVPEPATLTSAAIAALMGLGVVWRRRKRAAV